MKRVHACQECGKETTAKGRFCSTACRFAFNNRRKQRGAELYDFFMEQRFNRESAQKNGLWAIMCRLAASYREEDEREREGRKSWQTSGAALERLPVAMKAKDVTIIQDHTGRSTGRRTR